MRGKLMDSTTHRNSSNRRNKQRIRQEGSEATVVASPALRLVQALAQHQQWLDSKSEEKSTYLLDPSLLTPTK
jgi:hypothetical protein